ncbi:DUF2975 domain-containing protein [Alkalibacillus almallahensis]|uniref:DUF2975 domain-containing protein n=1 Tax=Alkalibacillus almallahensis TaxID=1379154 RepID=UPI0014221583|nr:DUF2975 domain-containing protein [Alkalibacillus almallahensis]
MKKHSTLILKLTVTLISLPVLIVSILGGYWLMQNPVNPDFAHILYPILIGVFVSVIPFIFALIQAMKLLNYIDHHQAFSDKTVSALNKIKLCAIVISGIYILILPFVYWLAEIDDAPGLILIGMAFAFAAFVVAVFAALLQKLLTQAIMIKTENDLTV